MGQLHAFTPNGILIIRAIGGWKKEVNKDASWKFRSSTGPTKMVQIWLVLEAKMAVFQAEKSSESKLISMEICVKKA